MLKHNKKFKNILLIGSSSDIGVAIINQLELENQPNIYLVGRTNPDRKHFINNNSNIIFKQCDFRKLNEVSSVANSFQKIIDLDLVIIAMGVLPEENCEFDLLKLEETLLVNSISAILLLSTFTELMKNHSGGRILVCSSVASLRPRIRNFSYGASKSALDFFTIGMQNKIRKTNVMISILRPGYVYTKMTRNFKPAPFSIKLDLVAKIAVKGLLKGQKIIYAPKKLKIIMNIVRILPRFIFDNLR